MTWKIEGTLTDEDSGASLAIIIEPGTYGDCLVMRDPEGVNAINDGGMNDYFSEMVSFMLDAAAEKPVGT